MEEERNEASLEKMGPLIMFSVLNASWLPPLSAKTPIGVENKKYPGPGKRRALDLLERELQAVVVWVVDINSGPLEDSNTLFPDPPQPQEMT